MSGIVVWLRGNANGDGGGARLQRARWRRLESARIQAKTDEERV